MKSIKEKIVEESQSCKYCDINKAKKHPGISFGKGDDAQLYIRYDDAGTDDEKYHFLIQSHTNHIDAWSQINYCPFCGRKLD